MSVYIYVLWAFICCEQFAQPKIHTNSTHIAVSMRCASYSGCATLHFPAASGTAYVRLLQKSILKSSLGWALVMLHQQTGTATTTATYERKRSLLAYTILECGLWIRTVLRCSRWSSYSQTALKFPTQPNWMSECAGRTQCSAHSQIWMKPRICVSL